MIRIITGKQLSSAAAYNIYRRLKQNFEDSVIAPTIILCSFREQLLACGLSNAKPQYITLIAKHLMNIPTWLMNWEKCLPKTYWRHYKDLTELVSGAPVSLRCFNSTIQMSFSEEISVWKKQSDCCTRKKIWVHCKWRPYRSTSLPSSVEMDWWRID